MENAPALSIVTLSPAFTVPISLPFAVRMPLVRENEKVSVVTVVVPFGDSVTTTLFGVGPVNVTSAKVAANPLLSDVALGLQLVKHVRITVPMKRLLVIMWTFLG
jgi:hypothetical protein